MATAASESAVSVASLEKKIALLTRELTKALERQEATARELSQALKQQTATSRELSESLERETATSQVLGIISSSPTDLEPLFETIPQTRRAFAKPISGSCTATTAMCSMLSRYRM